MRRSEAVDILLYPTDFVEIETQYDERRKTVLYVHVNGVTVLRIQGLAEESQLEPKPVIEMHAHKKIEPERRGF